MGETTQNIPEITTWAPTLSILCTCIRSLSNTIEGVAVGAGVGVGLLGVGGLGVAMVSRWVGCLLVMVISLVSCLFAHGLTSL